MSLFGPPPNVGVGEALHLIFSHYCSPWKSTVGASDATESKLTMDGMSFSKMCRESPDLDKYIGRTDIDVIFAKTKPQGVRRLEFDNFLDTLLELAVRIFPDDDPTLALANFLAKFIFSLFAQQPSPDGAYVIEKIHNELLLVK